MSTSPLISKSISLQEYGIKNEHIHYQLPPEELHEITLKEKMGKEASSGALAVETGEFTGRSPLDRFIVRDALTEDKVWWGAVNIPFDPDDFDALYRKVAGYLEDRNYM